MTVGAVHKEFGIWYWKCSLLFNYLDKIHTDGGVLFWPLSEKNFPVWVFVCKSSKCLFMHILCHRPLIPCLCQSLCKQTDLLQSPQSKIQDGCKHQHCQSRVLFTYLQITWWGIFPASVSSCFAFFAANSSASVSVGMANPGVKWGIKPRECINVVHTVCCLKLCCSAPVSSALAQFLSIHSYTALLKLNDKC